MLHIPTHRPAYSAPLVLLLAAGCETPPADPLGPGASSPAVTAAEASPRFSSWSEPIRLGPPINTDVRDGNPALSPDGLSLYFDSDRTDLPGAQGAGDMWVSRRACTDELDPACAWQTPKNLSKLNSEYVEGGPEISQDGHLLFYLSHGTREDCPFTEPELDPTRPCDADIYVTWRPDPTDDFGWMPPVRLPSGVNSKFEDNEAVYLPNVDPGHGNLYFSRTVPGPGLDFDIYSAAIRITRRGNPSGIEVTVVRAATPVSELNLPGVLDTGVTIRADGKEIFFNTAFVRRGGLGALDIYTSTRRSPTDPWSEPVPAEGLNHRRADLSPSLSRDGRTMYFTSNRPLGGGFVGWDIYMSTRTPLERPD